jgi:DNA polymerase
MQLKKLHKEIDSLHDLYGDSSLSSIYGAGCIENPSVLLMFMNPTAKNISSHKKWTGLRAPWLGTKNIWSLLRDLGFITDDYFNTISALRPEEWTTAFSSEIYSHLAAKSIYITNLAKCTQLDARPLKDDVFRKYLDVVKKEISIVNPKHIITFGNQVSSILLSKPVSVSAYAGIKKETLTITGKVFDVYPTYYPVGHGRMNQPLAIKRIKAILK